MQKKKTKDTEKENKTENKNTAETKNRQTKQGGKRQTKRSGKPAAGGNATDKKNAADAGKSKRSTRTQQSSPSNADAKSSDKGRAKNRNARYSLRDGENSSLKIKKKSGAKVKIIPLGGLNEIGKNMTVLECEDDILIIDCGLGFPDEDMLGIDLVIPDFSYLEANKEKIRGVVVTHGHEDHVGGIPYLLRTLDIPVYGTNLTLGIIRNKLEEHQLSFKPRLNRVSAGDTVKLGKNFSVEFIHVNHSIADACALAIDTPVGKMVHTGDFKLDLTPIDGEPMDITRLGEIGKEGVLLLMCESTNAERQGYTPSERKVGKSLEYIFATNKDKRIVIATFSSNVHRVQQIIDTSARHGRKVAITGRSMLNIVGAAVELGYMHVPAGVLVDINEIKRYKPDELTLITTGSQGEPMSALYRMAFSDHNQVSLDSRDLVVLSSSPIPGNEKLIGRIINELTKNGVTVLHDALVEVHVSGHACQEELKLMQSLIRPKFFMPVHGEYRHLNANRLLAVEMGTPESHIFISDIGKVLEVDEESAKWNGTVPAGKTLIDGYGIGDVGNIVLRDRRHLSQDGLIVVVASVDMDMRLLLSGPDIVSRGFVYVRESEELMDDIRKVASETIEKFLEKTDSIDRTALKTEVKDDLSKFLYSKTKRKPMVLPVIMNM